jgi:hypothetical protein
VSALPDRSLWESVTPTGWSYLSPVYLKGGCFVSTRLVVRLCLIVALSAGSSAWAPAPSRRTSPTRVRGIFARIIDIAIIIVGSGRHVGLTHKISRKGLSTSTIFSEFSLKNWVYYAGGEERSNET